VEHLRKHQGADGQVLMSGLGVVVSALVGKVGRWRGGH
jgi:hypothetical protein